MRVIHLLSWQFPRTVARTSCERPCDPWRTSPQAIQYLASRSASPLAIIHFLLLLDLTANAKNLFNRLANWFLSIKFYWLGEFMLLIQENLRAKLKNSNKSLSLGSSCCGESNWRMFLLDTIRVISQCISINWVGQFHRLMKRDTNNINGSQ